MRIILCTFDINGGDGRTIHRIHTDLLENGIDLIMLVKEKHSDDQAVIQVPVCFY